jgi:hypothetical protein
VDQVVAAFAGFAGNDAAWPERFTWKKYELEQASPSAY